MVKKFSTLALAALLALPAAASATSTPAELEAQIQQLTKQLDSLKQEMSDLKDTTDNKVESLSEKSEKWDEAARIQLSGDFRTRIDYVSADTPSAYTAMNVARGVNWFTDPAVLSNPQISLGPGQRYTTTQNTHTIDPDPTGANPAYANVAAAQGTANMLYGFFLTDPTSPSVGNAVNSALGASMKISQVLYGNDNSVYINPTTGVVITAKAINLTTGIPTDAAAPTLLSPAQRAHNLADLMKEFSPSQRVNLFAAMGYQPGSAQEVKNDTMWTNRLRVNLRAKATEDIEFKARLAMYKSWGMENNPVDYQENFGMGGGPFMLNSLSFDGNSTRQPSDNALRVDRAFMNWNNIGGTPTWFSIGRRPTTDGPPTQFRMGVDERLATPVAYMDYPFDGLSLGYSYKSLFGVEDFPGRVRFCYGRGFEAGPEATVGNGSDLKDTDFGGLSWDVYSKNGRFFNIQSFIAANMFNVPDGVTFPNPIEFAMWENSNTLYNPLNPNQNLILDRANLGDIYHTDAVYYDKYQNLNYFLTLGWSHTSADGMDEMGTSLLGSWWDTPSDKDGYSVYAGVRYDIPDSPFKVGLEYNYGTKNWISFTPGNDDLYASKLATRGHVIEAYGIWNIPAGEAISKFGKAFMRLGYQHYQYDYTGSGFWLGEPLDINDLKNDPLAAQFYTPVDSMDQVYATIEAWF